MIDFSVTKEKLLKIKTELLVVGMFEGEKTLEPGVKELDKMLDGLISQTYGPKGFRGKSREHLLFFTFKKITAPRLLLLGLGKKSEYSLENLRASFPGVIETLQKHHLKDLVMALPKAKPVGVADEATTQAVTEGLLLSSYKFLEYQVSKKNDKSPDLARLQFTVPDLSKKKKLLAGAKRGEIISMAVNYARDLANHPGNVMTPESLAEAAKKLAAATKIKCRVIEKDEMAKLGMGALLGVNQGSVLPPKFIILEYNHNKAGSPIVLIGKGITFDSGGLSLKPSKSMDEMKFDMCGAASVLGIFKAAAELKLPHKLVGLIPATENLPSGSALKPGDIIRAMSGKTIEVLNTDAEGRMILADALSYAGRYKPKLVIDYATLTGAVVVALGTEISGAFSTDENLMQRLRSAAEISGEKIWPLPLAAEYKEDIKSSVADIKNIGNDAKGAGTITAALFLQEFVSYPWIHLDIAGTAFATSAKPLHPKGATGAGVRLTLEFLK